MSAEQAPAPSALSVHCLDGFRVHCGTDLISVQRWSRKKVGLLFKYLLVSRHPVPCTCLLEEFWPHLTIKAARHNLAVTLYNLRRVLEPDLKRGEKSYYIISEGDLLGLNWSAVSFYDVDEFLARRREGVKLQLRGMAKQAVPELMSALKLYKMDFLADAVHEGWILDERDRLRNAYLDVLEHLSDTLIKLGRYHEAYGYANRLVQLNRCSEEGHRMLMEILMLLGHRSQAIAQYQLCREILERERRIAPGPETEQLYQRIANGGDI